MTCFCCCSWNTYHASVVPFDGPEIFSRCRLEYIDNKRFLNVLHMKPNVTPSGLPTHQTPPPEPHKINQEVEAKVSAAKDPHVVHSVPNEESDSDADTTNKTVVVRVDLERPNTSETLNSRLSLPPLSMGSPANGESLAKRHLKKLRSLLPKRQTTEKLMNDTQAKPKRVSVFSLRTRKTTKTSDNLDIIQACPEPELSENVSSINNNNNEERKRNISTVSFASSNFKPVDPSQFAMFFIHGVGGSLKIWQNQISYFYDKGKRYSMIVRFYYCNV